MPNDRKHGLVGNLIGYVHLPHTATSEITLWSAYMRNYIDKVISRRLQLQTKLYMRKKKKKKKIQKFIMHVC